MLNSSKKFIVAIPAQKQYQSTLDHLCHTFSEAGFGPDLLNLSLKIAAVMLELVHMYVFK